MGGQRRPAILKTLTYLGREFFGIEGLGDVVVAFQVEASQAVGLLGAVGEEKD